MNDNGDRHINPADVGPYVLGEPRSDWPPYDPPPAMEVLPQIRGGETRPFVYVAGPMATDAERNYIENLAIILNELEYPNFVPHRDTPFNHVKDGEHQIIYLNNVWHLDRADVVIVVTDRSTPGTAWEMGYAKARGKFLLAIATDWRGMHETAISLMVQFSADTILGSLGELDGYLRSHWMADESHGSGTG